MSTGPGTDFVHFLTPSLNASVKSTPLDDFRAAVRYDQFMAGRSQRATIYARRGPSTDAREYLETRWRERMTYEPKLVALVTAGGAQREPYHRWMRYKQGFSPELVRTFLREADRPSRSDPILDPFCGGGTVVTECARRGISAWGIDALESLVFLANARAYRDVPPLPDSAKCGTWQEVAEGFKLDVHRVALMLAVGQQHTTAGRPNKNAEPLQAVLGRIVRHMREDMTNPLPCWNPVKCGDARNLTTIAAGSVGAILTSPPYLSRHDYTRLAAPYELVYRYLHPAPVSDPHAGQLPAHARAATATDERDVPPPAVAEACQSLVAQGDQKLAIVVRAYFLGLGRVLEEWSQVLRPGSPSWVVIGGARLKDVYIPSDTIFADLAEARGFDVDCIRVARDLIDSRRKFGRIGHVAPRESIVILKTPG